MNKTFTDRLLHIFGVVSITDEISYLLVFVMCSIQGLSYIAHCMYRSQSLAAVSNSTNSSLLAVADARCRCGVQKDSYDKYTCEVQQI